MPTSKITLKEIKKRLLKRADEKNRRFFLSLTPGLDEKRVLGVRTPELRKLAAEIGTDREFLDDLPHQYFEEDQLHAIIISFIRDYDEAIRELDVFLPYVNNWATADILKINRKASERKRLSLKVREWLTSGHEYTVRFAIKVLMDHYLEEDFSPEYPDTVAAIRDERYYVRMMQAWYFATALAKQWDAILPYIEERKLEEWTHRKTISKAIESYRISPEKKEVLRRLK